MDHEGIKPEGLQPFLIGLFPPAMRVSALKHKEFRDRLGLSVDANVRFDEIGVTFGRSALFTNVRDLLSSRVTEARIEDTEKVVWSMSIDTERTRIKIATESKNFFIPDFSCLHPGSAERLKWFDAEVRKVSISDARMRKWREVLKERNAEDEEVDELLKEFRLTPRNVAAAIKNLFRQQTISVGSLVPDDLRYFDRLVGEPTPGTGLRDFYETTVGPRSTELVEEGTSEGLKDCFLVASHPFAAQHLRLDDVSKDKILDFYFWLETGGDRFSQLGGIEWGFRKLGLIPELEPRLERLVQILQADNPDDREGRLSLLSNLIILVEGELARTGICRDREPYWRRLSSIAHASVLERAIATAGMPPSDFSDWIMETRGLLYYLQTFVDMRREPRWNPDFVRARQLKAEFVGRIAGAVPIGISYVKSENFRKLLEGDGEGSIRSQIDFPYSFLPGPLEGGVESVVAMPEEIETSLREGLQGDELTPKSFVTLVNSALIYRIDAVFAELAADGLRRVKHQLRHIKSQDEAFDLLGGLATVAAVTRSQALAEEVRVLMRVVRSKPGINITQENAMRISMIAAASRADRADWCRYVGDCITEFSFEEMDRQDALVLRHRLVVLRQLEPQLWLTTARADAATSALLQLPAA